MKIILMICGMFLLICWCTSAAAIIIYGVASTIDDHPVTSFFVLTGGLTLAITIPATIFILLIK